MKMRISVVTGVLASLAASRRLLFVMAIAAAALAQPAIAREGVDVGNNSAFAKFVPAEQVERSAAQQYLQMLSQADSKRALAHSDSAELKRLRSIAQKIIPFAIAWNPRAKEWKWEVNLIGSNQINAYCMPGGKIAFFTGILQQLRLTDDEVAMVMGHEIAHALREHARERMGKGMATQGVARLGGALVSSFFGIDPRLTDIAAGGIANLTTLVFSREDESEADLVGMELAARAGYDPRAGVTLWQKMGAASKGAPPQWLSTHPAGARRIADIQANLPKVLPLYERARVK
jgi:predicted Zn-dependent protease